MRLRAGFVRPRSCRLRPLAALLLALATLAAPAALRAQQQPESAQQARERPSVAVLPFEALRDPAGEAWLALYVEDMLTLSLLRSGRGGVVHGHAARQWRHALDLDPLEAPPAEALSQLDVQGLVHGTVQEVLQLARVTLRGRGPNGPLGQARDETGIPALRVQAHLARDPPQALVDELVQAVVPALLPGADTLAYPDAPPTWAPIRELYTRLAGHAGEVDADPAAEARSHQASLEALQAVADREPALGGAAYQAMAEQALRRAMLHLPEGEARRAALRNGLSFLERVEALDATTPYRRALAGELHHWLGDDYQAKTAASVARLRNPREPLAYVVLALSAGLSTGRANEMLGTALSLHPGLRAEQRAPDLPLYQGGVLEPMLARWDELRERPVVQRDDDYQAALSEGIRAYEAGRLEEAERVLRKATQMEQYDHRPWLYLYRILLRTGRPEEAVQGLRELAAEYPQEAAVHHALGRALANAGDLEGAVEAYEAALREAPQDVQTEWRLANVQMQRQAWRSALRHLHAVLQQSPGHAGAWVLTGRAYGAIGQWEDAESAFIEALAVDPDLQAAQEGLSEARQRLEP